MNEMPLNGKIWFFRAKDSKNIFLSLWAPEI